MSEKETAPDGTKPETLKAVRVWLEDGSRVHGMWTGSCWWSTKGEVFPIKWELKERAAKTKKIVESLSQAAV